MGGCGMICDEPTRAYPDGRTGTAAGWQAHRAAGEIPCDPCRLTQNDRAKASKQTEDGRERQAIRARKRGQALRKYGLTLEDYDSILASQGGCCAICGTANPGGRWGEAGRFHVDHDHSCCPGKESCGECVRGLLCAPCNVGLGAFSDKAELLRKAADYLLTKIQEKEEEVQ